MPKLPAVTAKLLAKFLVSQGFTNVRTSGSHMRFHHQDGRRTTVAHHLTTIPKGTLLAILKQTHLNKTELVKYCSKKNRK